MGDMGYGGKVAEQQRARELRAQAWTLDAIARELGVSKSSVSLWVRDVEFTPRPRNRGHSSMRPHPMHVKKLAEIERCRVEGLERIGTMTEREFLMFGLALYAGEGAKRPGGLRFANSDPRMILAYVTWLRRFFEIDERRLRIRLYLHEDLDLGAAVSFWCALTDIPPTQVAKPYRAVADATIRRNRHVYGCPGISYDCTTTHRRVMAMIEAILSTSAFPG
jgi:transcriptional regulator with XRE-family HTH domain